MRIQIDRTDIERLLQNTPAAAVSIGIDMDEQTIAAIDRTGRERGSIHTKVEIVPGPRVLQKGATT
jgi:hypothetical protein